MHDDHLLKSFALETFMMIASTQFIVMNINTKMYEYFCLFSKSQQYYVAYWSLYFIII